MSRYSRRDFLKTGLAAGAVFGVAGPLLAEPQRATDWVELGHSGVRVTRLAFGTGSMGGEVQRRLGQDEFTRQVRYAYDHGIRFFETAESYGDMHRMLGVALKGIPRDSYRLMSKVTTREGVDPQAKFDELRKLATRTTSTSCCSTGSTPRRGPRIPRDGRTASQRPNIVEPSSAMARPFTASPRCASAPATNGCMSR